MGMSPYEGHDVIASGVEMPGASGGLNKALSVNALELQHDDRCYLIVETTVVKVRYDKVKDTDCLQRVHVLRVDNATPIDEGAVREALDAQIKLQEEAAGVHRLSLGETDDDDPADDPED